MKGSDGLSGSFVFTKLSSSFTYYTQRPRPFYGGDILREISWQKEWTPNKRASWQSNKGLPVKVTEQWNLAVGMQETAKCPVWTIAHIQK